MLLESESLRSTVARVRGQPFHYLEAGDGPQVLLLHGLSASSHVWRELIDQRSSQFHFLAPDLPCSGQAGSYQSMSPVKLADDFAALLEELKARPAFVVGHSYGGLIALELARRSPKSVRGLLLVAPPALGLASLKRLLRFGSAERVWSWLGKLRPSASAVRAYLRFMWGEPRGVTDALVRRYIDAISADGFHGAQLEALRELAHYALALEGLRALKLPISVMWGERDRLLALSYGEQVAHALEVPLKIVPGAGHFLPEEAPMDVAAALDALARRPKRPTKR